MSQLLDIYNSLQGMWEITNHIKNVQQLMNVLIMKPIKHCFLQGLYSRPIEIK